MNELRCRLLGRVEGQGFTIAPFRLQTFDLSVDQVRILRAAIGERLQGIEVQPELVVLGRRDRT
jgi:hypothetical protein